MIRSTDEATYLELTPEHLLALREASIDVDDIPDDAFEKGFLDNTDDIKETLPEAYDVLATAHDLSTGLYRKHDTEYRWERVPVQDIYNTHQSQLEDLTLDSFDTLVKLWETDPEEAVEELADEIASELYFVHGRPVVERVAREHLRRLETLKGENRKTFPPKQKLHNLLTSRGDIDPRVADSIASEAKRIGLLDTNSD